MTRPSMRKSLPVTKPPSEPMRSAPTFPTSSGVPARPATVRRRRRVFFADIGEHKVLRDRNPARYCLANLTRADNNYNFFHDAPLSLGGKNFVASPKYGRYSLCLASSKTDRAIESAVLATGQPE